jgi:hypothetical protein
MRSATKVIVAALSAAMLLGVPAAYGATSAVQGYSQPGGVVQTQLDNGGGNSPGVATSTTPPPAKVTTAKGGELPFTGLDLALVVMVGATLVALGLGTRRLSQMSSARAGLDFGDQR